MPHLVDAHALLLCGIFERSVDVAHAQHPLIRQFLRLEQFLEGSGVMEGVTDATWLVQGVGQRCLILAMQLTSLLQMQGQIS